MAPLLGKVAPELLEKGYPFPQDGDQPAVRLAFDDRDFEAITSLAPRPTDPPGSKGRAMRFATYLHRTIDQSTARGRPVRRADPTGPSGRARPRR